MVIIDMYEAEIYVPSVQVMFFYAPLLQDAYFLSEMKIRDMTIISLRRENKCGCCGCWGFPVGVLIIRYGCQPASMGVSTPTVEYNSSPMILRPDSVGAT